MDSDLLSAEEQIAILQKRYTLTFLLARKNVNVKSYEKICPFLSKNFFVDKKLNAVKFAQCIEINKIFYACFGVGALLLIAVQL